MSHYRLNDEDMPGYFLPEESQLRLARLSDHVRFLSRMAQPRTQEEDRAAEPKARMGELAFCLELLADQVDLVLDEVSWPAQRTDKMRVARPDATADDTHEASSGAFRVTLEQIDRLNLLIETASAHARVMAVGDTTERAGQALPEVGDTIFDAVNEVRALLLQIESQPLRGPKSEGVREERAVYAVGPVAPPIGGARLH